MKKSFEEFVDLCRKSIKYDPWADEKGVEGYCEGLQDEVDEVLEALKNKDYENLCEELGDVFLDWLHVCLIAEKLGHFDTKTVIEEVKAKLARRKPFLEENRTVSKEEARNLWISMKQKEKELKNQIK